MGVVAIGHFDPATSGRSCNNTHDPSLAGSGYRHVVSVPKTIICVDCGGTCHLLSYEPDEGFVAGDIVAFRCEDCVDRWDIELDADDLDDDVSRGT